jgi:hypothetical protein
LELTVWRSIQDSTSATDFEEYLQRYPNGTFVTLAPRKVSALNTRDKGTSAGLPQQQPAPTPERSDAFTGWWVGRGRCSGGIFAVVHDGKLVAQLRPMKPSGEVADDLPPWAQMTATLEPNGQLKDVSLRTASPGRASISGAFPELALDISGRSGGQGSGVLPLPCRETVRLQRR